MKIILISLLCGFFLGPILFCGTAMTASLRSQPYTVLEAYGHTEVLNPSSPEWKAIPEKTVLIPGSKVRTGQKSYIDLAGDDQLERLVRLCENARFEFLPNGELRLEQGRLLLLREISETGKTNLAKFEIPMVVSTPETRCRLTHGGFSADVSSLGTWIRVYSEQVLVESAASKNKLWSKPQNAEEGFKYFYSSAGDAKRQEDASVKVKRLSFSDYRDWQVWIKKSYEKKDNLVAHIFMRDWP